MAKKTTDYPVKRRQLMQDIKEKNFHKSYLLYGPEAFLRNRYRDMLRDALMEGGDSMNLQVYRGEDINPVEVIDMAETLPFFADRRVIVLEDTGIFKKGCPELASYLKEPAETVNFVFVEEEIDKRKDIYKSLDKEGLVLECITQTPEDLQHWSLRILEKNGKKADGATLRALIERVGTDMSNIYNEVEKLICYVGEREIVTTEDVEAVCAGWITNRIFDMTEAISDKNTRKAMDLYYDLLALKVKPDAIYGAITRQFNVLLQVKELDHYRQSAQQIADVVKIHPYFIQTQYLPMSKKYTMQELRDIVENCMRNDEDMKRGLLDRNIYVEMLIAAATVKN